MIEQLIFLSSLELFLTDYYVAANKFRKLRSFRSMNAKAQCENYIKLMGGESKCLKVR